MALTQLNELTSPLESAQLSSLNTAIESMTPTQVAWVSGYLAGIAHLSNVPKVNAESRLTVTILYGSQTGNGKAIAESLGKQASAQGISAQVISMGDYRSRNIAKETLVLFVVSTQGEGEAPETAQDLYSYLHGKRAPDLSQLKYAVFGLGDSSYPQFNQAAKDFDTQLAKLGAQRLLDRVDADVDYQDTANSWIEQTITTSKDFIPEESNVVPLTSSIIKKATYNKDKPYSATLEYNQKITTDAAIADIRHLVLSIDPEQIQYQAGDTLGIWFRNSPQLVSEILSATNLSAQQLVQINKNEIELEKALIEKLELTQLHPMLVKKWSELSSDEKLKAIANNDGQLRSYIYGRQVLDLVREYPVALDANSFIQVLQPLKPRLYSIASSQSVYEDEIHLTIGVVRYHTHGRKKLGGSSGYVAERLDEQDQVDIYVVENTAFRLPENGDAPIIMIGAGTGIAPYRGFLQQREANKDTGENWLIFGNRNFQQDFIYQAEWVNYRNNGLLNRIDLAFSRDQSEPLYVQHRIKENAAEIFQWLQQGAHIYVCGSTQLGNATHQALLDLIIEQARTTAEQANTFIDNLRHDGRYHRDIY